MTKRLTEKLWVLFQMLPIDVSVKICCLDLFGAGQSLIRMSPASYLALSKRAKRQVGAVQK